MEYMYPLPDRQEVFPMRCLKLAVFTLILCLTLTSAAIGEDLGVTPLFPIAMTPDAEAQTLELYSARLDAPSMARSNTCSFCTR